jgi:hypothetical protein
LVWFLVLVLAGGDASRGWVVVAPPLLEVMVWVMFSSYHCLGGLLVFQVWCNGVLGILVGGAAGGKW